MQLPEGFWQLCFLGYTRVDGGGCILGLWQEAGVARCTQWWIGAPLAFCQAAIPVDDRPAENAALRLSFAIRSLWRASVLELQLS